MSDDFYRSQILPYAAIIIKICRAYSDSEEDFEDYYQEVCLQIWRSRDNFRGDADWSTWIYRLSLNVCLTLLKKRKRSAETRDGQLPDMSQETQGAFSDEDLDLLYQAIRSLSEVDRAVILLHLEEKSYAEIAEIMGTNANNIGVRIKRIKDKLKKKLDGKIY